MFLHVSVLVIFGSNYFNFLWQRIFPLGEIILSLSFFLSVHLPICLIYRLAAN